MADQNETPSPWDRLRDLVPTIARAAAVIDGARRLHADALAAFSDDEALDLPEIRSAVLLENGVVYSVRISGPGGIETFDSGRIVDVAVRLLEKDIGYLLDRESRAYLSNHERGNVG